MTFTNMDSFVEWLLTVDEVTIQETNFIEDDFEYVVLEDLRETEPLVLAEVLISAYDSGFHFGSFFADRYNGMLTISD